METVDDSGHGQAHGFRLVKGEYLGRQFPPYHVQEGDNNEGYEIRERMRPPHEFFAVAKYTEGLFDTGIQYLGERDHSNGAETQGNQGDTVLGDGVEALWLIVEHLDNLGGFVAGAR